jgi:hypothetical protein
MVRPLLISVIVLALLSPASAGEAWVLWQKEGGQVSGRFKDTWTVVGAYGSERECRAAWREMLSGVRRTHTATDSADAVIVQDPLGWRLTYACRPGGKHPR